MLPCNTANPVILNDDRSEKVLYDYPDYPIYIRRGLLSFYPEYKASSHWHDDVEFISVLNGRMQYSVNGEIIDLKAGDGIFVNSGQMHFGFSDNRQECDFLCILFHPLLLSSAFPFETDFVIPLIRNSGLPFLPLHASVPWHNEIISRLYQLYTLRQTPTAPMHSLSAFAGIWSLLCDHAPSDVRNKSRQNQDLIITKNMVGFIQKNYKKKMSLAEIAAAGAVGESKCCRLFAKYFSQSPNQYLNQYRLNKSLDLLLNTDLPITEIALCTGFSGASYYAEMFRRWMGKSPREYRNSAI